ncbi:MAG: hypothetical protein V1917_04685 [Candidatus Gottesmanbacteria bacterium]
MQLSHHTFSPTSSGHPIIGFQSKETRALTVGYIKKNHNKERFISCREHVGALREEDAFTATVQSLQLSPIQELLKRYEPHAISTITLLRETIACRLSSALYYAGIKIHHGDCFIGANHIKTGTSITTSYAYENTEGLCENGLWVIADSIAAGRNLIATLNSMLGKYHPKELVFIVPIGNRWGINEVSRVVAEHDVKATFVVWGALFGLNPENKYDEPWGLPDCEPIDIRDKETFVSIYGKHLCVGGDFGNDYYCPALAKKLYEKQLEELQIIPNIPTAEHIRSLYSSEEIITR